MADRDSSSTTANATASRATTYIITNGTKVLGAYVVLAEQAGEGRKWVLIAGAALALGAQTVEAIIIAAIDRFFGGREESRP